MKQEITIQQLNELSDKGKDQLKKWYSKRYDKVALFGETFPDKQLINPLLSIGQMIEFLREKVNGDWKHKPLSVLGEEVYPFNGILADNFTLDINLTCDNLWLAVKKVLETQLDK